jgi:hypothetical protein
MSKYATARFAAFLALAVTQAPLPALASDRGDRIELAWLDGPTWYAIAGSYPTRQQANARAKTVGPDWIVSNSDICTNYTPGYWVVVAGSFNVEDAKANASNVPGAYVKECL